jgi:hypothetical protein
LYWSYILDLIRFNDNHFCLFYSDIALTVTLLDDSFVMCHAMNVSTNDDNLFVLINIRQRHPDPSINNHLSIGPGEWFILHIWHHTQSLLTPNSKHFKLLLLFGIKEMTYNTRSKVGKCSLADKQLVNKQETYQKSEKGKQPAEDGGPIGQFPYRPISTASKIFGNSVRDCTCTQSFDMKCVHMSAESLTSKADVMDGIIHSLQNSSNNEQFVSMVIAPLFTEFSSRVDRPIQPR